MQLNPGLPLRIVLFIVSKEGGVRELLQARGIISHDVVLSREEGGQVAVAVEALVLAREAA